MFTALHGLVRFVLGGVPGRDRNNRLYWAACRAAEMVAAGLVNTWRDAGALLYANWLRLIQHRRRNRAR